VLIPFLDIVAARRYPCSNTLRRDLRRLIDIRTPASSQRLLAWQRGSDAGSYPAQERLGSYPQSEPPVAHTRDQGQWNCVYGVGAHNVLWTAPARRSAGKGNALRCSGGRRHGKSWRKSTRKPVERLSGRLLQERPFELEGFATARLVSQPACTWDAHKLSPFRRPASTARLIALTSRSLRARWAHAGSKPCKSAVASRMIRSGSTK
jgi:hypothetical protein